MRWLSVPGRRTEGLDCKGDGNVLNYEEELKKFKPCLDVDEVEDAIYSRDLTDVIDILKEMQRSKSEPQEPAKE